MTVRHRMPLALAVATAALALVAAASVTTPAAAAPITTTIAAGQQLWVQGESDTSTATSTVLATLTVTTSTANETRLLEAALPVQHTRVGTVALPDRFYHDVGIRCVGAAVPAGVTGRTNLLADGTTTLTPRALVTLPTAGTHTCTLSYRLVTSQPYDDATDDVVTISGGFLRVGDPVAGWSEQCYWPTTIAAAPPQCDVTSAAEVASVKVTAADPATRRTPVRVSIPPGTVFTIRADAALTSCGGTGGNEGLCGADEGSFLTSTVTSTIGLFPQASGSGYCKPTPVDGQSGVASQTIAVKEHHTMLYHSGRWQTSSDPACTTDYIITNEIRVTAGSPIVLHRNGSLLMAHT